MGRIWSQEDKEKGVVWVVGGERREEVGRGKEGEKKGEGGGGYQKGGFEWEEDRRGGRTVIVKGRSKREAVASLGTYIQWQILH